MPLSLARALRRRLAVLLIGVLTVATVEVALPVSDLAPGTATAVADSGTTYDRGLGASECSLLGRSYSAALGCAREKCVEGAVPWRKVLGAEVCALAGQPEGYGYAATVNAVDCRDLHRRWIAAVNYCASQPDRSRRLVVGAVQCASPASVYVTLSERPGRYDECLTRGRAVTLVHRASARGTTLAEEVAREQRRAPEGSGGVLVVGDSVTWRGNDELAELWPELTVDAQPARRPSELTALVGAFRAHHGPPTGLVVELGSNAAPGYARADLAAAVARVPAEIPVLFVLPYVESAPGVVSAWSQRFDTWMRSVAAGRPGSCVADWPAYVADHPGLLQDGIHVRHDAEGEWAAWVARQWSDC